MANVAEGFRGLEGVKLTVATIQRLDLMQDRKSSDLCRGCQSLGDAAPKSRQPLRAVYDRFGSEPFTRQQAEVTMQAARSTVSAHLKAAVGAGVVVRDGSGRVPSYRVVVPPPSDGSEFGRAALADGATLTGTTQ
jgi:hypothetical protein